MKFTKMQGTGNDFIVIDQRDKKFNLSKSIIKNLSDRHFGIGFDQLLILEKSNAKNADFRYRIFNSDGGEVEQCGNGARCFYKFIKNYRLSNNSTIKVETCFDDKKDGDKTACETEGDTTTEGDTISNNIEVGS